MKSLRVASPNFSTDHLIGLFGRMARTYGWVNLLSSFGFSHGWRKRCVQELDVRDGARCADLMAGMGEMSVLLERLTEAQEIEAVDFCPQMCAQAGRTVSSETGGRIRVHEADVLKLDRPEAFDRIAIGFGLKTLDDASLCEFARRLGVMLRPGGKMAAVEIHTPRATWVRIFFLTYVRWVIPAIGRMLLGDPDCYRSLAVYTEDFAKRDQFTRYLREAGLVAEERALFFGCARLYVATKRGSGLDMKEGGGRVAGDV